MNKHRRAGNKPARRCFLLAMYFVSSSQNTNKENGDFTFFVYNLAQPCYNASRLVSTPSPSAGLPPRSFGCTGLAARRGPFSKQKMEVSQT